MKMATTLLFVLLLLSSVVEGGILKGRRKGGDDEAVETLLAVGLIAKALSDSEKQCPPPVTKIIHVPVHTERIYVVKDNSKDHHEGWSSESSKAIWKKKA